LVRLPEPIAVPRAVKSVENCEAPVELDVLVEPEVLDDPLPAVELWFSCWYALKADWAAVRFPDARLCSSD